MENNLKVTNDFVFHKIFGEKGNESILKSLLEAITERKIDSLEILEDTKLEKAFKEDKLGILDVKAKLHDGTKVDIEIQIADKKNIEKRTLFYWAKLHTQYVEEGTNYKDIPNTITINILAYNFLPKNKYHRVCHIRYGDLAKEILTENLEIHFIDLVKFRKNVENVKDYLTSWLSFIEGSRREMVSVAKDRVKEIEEAYKRLETLQKDTGAMRIYELKQKAIMDEASAKGEAYRKGIEVGEKKGIERGIKEGKLEIARKLLKQKICKEDIIKITEISEEELEKIKK